MKKAFEEWKNFIKKPVFVLPLLAACVLGYAYAVCRFTVGIDDLVRDRYLGGISLSQGRYGSILVSYSFGLVKAFPVVEPLLAVLFYMAAAALYAVLLKKVCGDRMHPLFYTAFACLFVSYPLINELFIYKGADLNSGIGYGLTALAVLLTWEAADNFRKNRKIYWIRSCEAALLWIFLFSLYESFAFAFVVILCCLLLSAVFSGKEGNSFLFSGLITGAGTLLAGYGLKRLLDLLILSVFRPKWSAPKGNRIVLPSSLSQWKDVLYTLFRKYVLASFWSLSLALLGLCLVIFTVFTLVHCIRRKNPAVLLCWLGVMAGLFGPGLLTGGAAKYRTAQSFALFCAFVLSSVIFGRVKKSGRRFAAPLAAALAGILVLGQALDLSRKFHDNGARWAEEKAVLTKVCQELKTANPGNKPVIFVGEYRLSDGVLSRKFVRSDDPRYLVLKKTAEKLGFRLSSTDLDDTYVLGISQSDNGSVISWGIEDPFAPNEELLRVCRYLGWEFTAGTREQYDAFSAQWEEDRAGCEEAYSIRETADCIVVGFTGK